MNNLESQCWEQESARSAFSEAVCVFENQTEGCECKHIRRVLFTGDHRKEAVLVLIFMGNQCGWSGKGQQRGVSVCE